MIDRWKAEVITHFFASIFKVYETFLDFYPLEEIIYRQRTHSAIRFDFSPSPPFFPALAFSLQPSISHSIRRGRNGRYAAPSLQILYHFYEA